MPLRFAGHEVTTVPNGAEAVDAALASPPDLILMDVRMPRMTGYEAREKIKSEPSIRHIPVVFLSAKGQGIGDPHRTGCRASEYLLKPFAPDELTQRVAVLLAQQTAVGEPA